MPPEAVWAKQLRRLKINAVAWAIGAVVLTVIWVAHEWQANGAFERFAHEGNTGEWNPTLWALGVGVWALIVGIMALRVTFERPPTALQLDREVDRLGGAATAAEVPRFRRRVREWVERVRQLRFHVAAWVFGMIVLIPLNALIEWQDNGRFERLSRDSQPGSWDPWVLYVGGIWALLVAAFAAWIYYERPSKEAHA